jgi:transcriptional regulator with XRE-family HTH domain
MKTLEDKSDKEIQQELGRRLKRERLNQNITQASLASRINISRRTLVAAEHGEGTTLETLIRILRGLDQLDQLDNFIPIPQLSPLQLAKLKGKERKKASGKLIYPTATPSRWVWKEDLQ